jgi:hypothetical protein
VGASVGATRRTFITEEVDRERHSHALFKWKGIAFQNLLLYVGGCTSIALVGVLLKNGRMMPAGGAAAI